MKSLAVGEFSFSKEKSENFPSEYVEIFCELIYNAKNVIFINYQALVFTYAVFNS